jgi:uncharacterized protein
VTLVNERTHTPLATSVELANTRRARRRGLLGRDAINVDEAMFISPCVAVHTAFMRFAIDVVFVDRDGRAVQIVQDMQPWRMAASLKGCAVIELAAGRVKACGVQVGDRLSLIPPSRGAGPACHAEAAERRRREDPPRP